MNEWLDALQWPAMATTLLATWLISSSRKYKRNWAFGWYISSNVLWAAWGWHDGAHALIALQFGLFLLNLRGLHKTDPDG